MRLTTLIPPCILALIACYEAKRPVVEAVPMFGDYKTNSPLIPAKRGAYKIAENESPRPADRAFLNYNYYNNVKRDLIPGTVSWHRAMIGVERTVLADASIGVRLPFFEGLDGNDFQFGDLTFLFKYAPVNSGSSRALSVGLAVTAPTGQVINRFVRSDSTTIHSALVQPFAGWLWTSGNVFVHGFHSLLLPTNFDDVAVLFNDGGLGYWAYRANGEHFLTGVIPTFEVHDNFPLNHRDASQLQRFRHVVDLTGGAHIELGRRYLLGLAFGAPVVTRQAFNYEFIASFSSKF